MFSGNNSELAETVNISHSEPPIYYIYLVGCVAHW